MCEDWSVKVQSGRQMCEAVAKSAKWSVKVRSGCQTCESDSLAGVDLAFGVVVAKGAKRSAKVRNEAR